MNGSRFRLRGDTTFSTPLGELCGVTPVAIPGHPPHVVASFLGGSQVEWDTQTVAKLIEWLPEAMASLAKVVDCSAIFTELRKVEQ